MGKISILFFCFVFAGCATSENAPLFFGQAHTVGISVGTNQSNQTPELVVGYKDANIAHIPTIAVNKNTGELLPIVGTTSKDKDAYSTFGQFQANTETQEISLGKFFATGIAARQLADGFACKVSRGTDSACKNRPAF